MKKFLRLLFLTISILIVSVPVFASETMLTSAYDTMLINQDGGYNPTIANGFDPNRINVQVNGGFINFTDSEGNIVNPQIINDRTMVPMRKIFEEFGAEIEWNGDTRSIVATTPEKEIRLQINNPMAIVKNIDGTSETITLDSVPVIVEDRTLVPVRFIAESLEKIVGWDVENRSVVIVEPKIIEEKIKLEASNLYDYLNTDFEIINTSVSNTDITGKIVYEDTNNSSNNSTLNVNGDAKINVAETTLQIDLDLDITGKGILMTTLKEEGLEKIKATMIVDCENGYMYISSNILGEEMNGKWARYEFDDSEKSMLKTVSAQSTNMDALTASLIQEENLFIGSFEELNMNLNLITSLMGNDNFTSSGRTTKTYKYEITLPQILEAMGYSEEEVKAMDETYDFEIRTESEVKNNVAKASNVNIDFGMVYDTEKIDIELTGETTLESYNEDVEINIPNVNDIVIVEAE